MARTKSSSTFFALLLLLASCGVYQSNASDAVFSDLLTLDCSQTLRLFGRHPVLASDIALPFANTVYQTLRSAVLNRASCHCPQLQGAALNSYFSLDVASALSALGGGPSQNGVPLPGLSALCNSASSTGFTFSLSQIGTYFNILFPSK